MRWITIFHEAFFFLFFFYRPLAQHLKIRLCAWLYITIYRVPVWCRLRNATTFIITPQSFGAENVFQANRLPVETRPGRQRPGATTRVNNNDDDNRNSIDIFAGVGNHSSPSTQRNTVCCYNDLAAAAVHSSCACACVCVLLSSASMIHCWQDGWPKRGEQHSETHPRHGDALHGVIRTWPSASSHGAAPRE